MDDLIEMQLKLNAIKFRSQFSFTAVSAIQCVFARVHVGWHVPFELPCLSSLSCQFFLKIFLNIKAIQFNYNSK